MARDDDHGGGKPKGTLALDISEMDLDDEGPRTSRRRTPSEDLGRRGGGPPERSAAGSGTLALDVSGMDLDDEVPSARTPYRPGRGGGGDQWGGGAAEPEGRGGRKDDARREPDRDWDLKLPDQPPPPTEEASLPVAEAPPQDPDSTRAIDLASVPGEPEQPSARLTLQTGSAENRVQTFRKDTITVGREVDNDIVLLDEQSSRHHFELRRRGSSFELNDLDSGNGTRVNGHVVKRVTLTEGALVRVGDTEFLFELVTPRAQAPSAGPAAPAPPGGAPDSPGPVPTPSEAPDGDSPTAPAGDADEAPPLALLVGFGAVGLLALTFGVLLTVYLLTGPKDDAAGAKAEAAKAAQSDDLPPELLVGPAMREADKAFGEGHWMKARRHLGAVLRVDPGHARAKQFLGRVDRALQTRDGAALRVTFDPERPKRGKDLTIRLRMGEPVRELRATFMGRPLVLKPSPDVPREYVGQVSIPKKTKKGEQELDVEWTDLQDGSFEFARRVAVR